MSVLLDINDHFDRFLQLKNENMITDPVKDEIKLLKVGKNDSDEPFVFGSYNMRIQKYPGDIDLREDYSRSCDEKCVIDDFEVDLKAMVKKVIAKRTHYYSEIKVGVDELFDIYLGDIENGIFIPDEHLWLDVKTLYENGMMEKDDLNKISLVLLQEKVLNADDFDIIQYIIRKYYILRWTSKEIISGKKKLSGKRTITLNEALYYPTLVKIDELTFIDSQIYEVTNAFDLIYLDENNNQVKIHPENPSIALREEAEKLYYSNMWYSPFKMVKRVYALCRRDLNFDKANANQYKSIIQKLIPLVSSNISHMYQLKSKIDSLTLLIELEKSPPMASIKKQLFSIETALSTIIEFNRDNYDKVHDIINKILKTTSRQIQISLLEEMSVLFKIFINTTTIYYLNKVGLNPLPPIVLPEYHLYNRRIIRKPTANPTNPLKLLAKVTGGNIDKYDIFEHDY